ncbi:hypothetical protein D1605_008180 [Xylella fastidiosa subsp. fastidiosa]|uniref:Uncharacterized protein n=1 Tax=Xylella fastidiosa (strain Temecula1 / ATCC 700964) TaxID=183190 RepID=Q87BC8_XYLFT|nr:conserved hypothetical protein [Xylella fastidiosa Temecula1]KGM20241.1 hypothetical protein JT24_08485 [Xylella fastidiosa]MBE0262236.1 hypothetical protein [Xylella fastidiosa subsp. fastidiosa]MBE0264368.1 hypothetical protein [Xylella fastidiosa subsp. fastidiosa]MBE0266522.1 hypothetical protein [Xylella fastidiosa subsp. fastidiosa]
MKTSCCPISKPTINQTLKDELKQPEAFHTPPQLFTLHVDTIPLLCRSKQDLILFLHRTGVTQEDRAEVQQPVDVDHHSITKFAIVRNVLTKVNTRGDNGLPARCDIVKRIAEFENFELC